MFPPIYLTRGQTTVEVMKIMVTSFSRSHAGTAALSAPSPAAGHRQPCLHWRLLVTHGQVWVSLLWGHCSFVLGPRVHKVLFVPSKSLFPQSCGSSGGSMVGLMSNLLQEGLCHTQVCCTQPYPSLLHPEPLPLQHSTADPYLLRRHPNTVLSQCLWDLWVLVRTRFV